MSVRTLLAAGFAIQVLAIGLEHPMTNADNFKRGLPPLNPRRLFESSQSNSAQRAKRSGSTTTVYIFGCNSLQAPYCCTSTADPGTEQCMGTGAPDTPGEDGTSPNAYHWEPTYLLCSWSGERHGGQPLRQWCGDLCRWNTLYYWNWNWNSDPD